MTLFTVARCAESPRADSSATKAVLFELAPTAELNRMVIPQEGGIELEFSFYRMAMESAAGQGSVSIRSPTDVVIVNGLLPDTPGLRQ